MNKIGKKAPPFYANTTCGEMYFPKSAGGRWTVLYYYPGDFMPQSASDIIAFSKKVPKFKAYGAQVIAVSADSLPVHIAWMLSLRNMSKDGLAPDIELVSDPDRQIAKLYGVLDSKSVFVIDPDGNIRAQHNYEKDTGLNVTETERELLAIMSGKITPSGWTPGEDFLTEPPSTLALAQSAIPDREKQGYICTDWYICYQKD